MAKNIFHTETLIFHNDFAMLIYCKEDSKILKLRGLKILYH